MPPAGGELLTVNTALQPNPPCVTVKTWPATVMVPLIGKLLVFAATAYPTVPLPPLLPPEVIVMKLLLLAAVQAQFEPLTLTVTLPEPPAALKLAFVEPSVKPQPRLACMT